MVQLNKIIKQMKRLSTQEKFSGDVSTKID